MIAEFLASWTLFHNTYLAGWSIALVLSLLGVLVVARDQIFIGAAISQASVLGVAVALRLGAWAAADGCGWCDASWTHTLSGGAFAVLGALATAAAGRPGGESREAVTGWIFLASSACAVLLLAHSPHGMEEVNTLLASTIIGATTSDLVTLGTAAALTVTAIAAWRQRWLLLVMDPEMAAAVGLPVAAMTRGFTLWLGLVIGLSIHVSGVVFTFGYLVLPALAAKNVCRELGAMLWVSPAIALVSAGVGFVLANSYDHPPGQMAVAVAAALVVAARGIRRARAQRL